jgi:hypothetical protein
VSAGVAAVLLAWMAADALTVPAQPCPTGTVQATRGEGCVNRDVMLARQIMRERREAASRVRRAYRLGYRRGVREVVATPSVDHAIRIAAATYGVPESHMRTVARCESGLRADASNRGVYIGVFQAGAPFWRTTPYNRFDRRDPYANALATAYVVARQGWRQWECKP